MEFFKDKEPEDEKEIECSFCGTPESETRGMIASEENPDLTICGNCIDLCQTTLRNKVFDVIDFLQEQVQYLVIKNKDEE